MKPLLILKSDTPLTESSRENIVDSLNNAQILVLGPEVDIIHLDKDGNLDYATRTRKEMRSDG